MGRFSRAKGYRNEILLRDAARAEGYDSQRVPLSGASAAFKGDVIVTKGGQTWSLELKARAPGTLGRIYALYETFRGPSTGILGLAIGEELISLHNSLDSAINGLIFYERPEDDWATYRPYVRTLNKLAGMKKWKGTASLLVLKEDRRPFIFIRWRDNAPG